MKHIILFLGFVFVAIATQAQTKVWDVGNTFKNITTDYTITNTTPVWFQFNAEKPNATTQDYQCKLSALTGLTQVTVSLWGRKFTDDTWVQIGSTVTSTGAETITISNTDQLRYRQYKVLFTGTGTGTCTIQEQSFKVWNE